jgi:hypothetical protein
MRNPFMPSRSAIALLALMTALSLAVAGARAQDLSRYPDWSGQWLRIGGIQWDPSKPLGRGQQPPLTPEYQAIFDASLADQSSGGQGNNARFTCIPHGMPRAMTATFPFEILIMPKTTYILFENQPDRRIYTDGRDWPRNPEPAFADVLHDEVTTIDHALTRPWTVTKSYRRERDPIWFDNNCAENNNHVVIGKENYFLSADGMLMPAKKDQPPPDLRYFKRLEK